MDAPDERPHHELALAEALRELTHELHESREERRHGLVTKDDLLESEAKIITAIQNGPFSAADQKLLDQLEARQEKIVRKLEALDALTQSGASAAAPTS